MREATLAGSKQRLATASMWRSKRNVRHGVEPLAYLRDVLSRLPSMTNQDDLGPLLPSRWKPRS